MDRAHSVDHRAWWWTAIRPLERPRGEIGVPDTFDEERVASFQDPRCTMSSVGGSQTSHSQDSLGNARLRWYRIRTSGLDLARSRSMTHASAGPDPAIQTEPGSRALDRSLVTGIAWTGAVKWSGQILSWLATLVVARILVPASFG